MDRPKKPGLFEHFARSRPAWSRAMADLYSELGYATEEAVSVLLEVKLVTLRNQRAKGIGPPYSKTGKTVLYPIDGLRRWLAGNTVTPEATAPTMIEGAPRRDHSTRPTSATSK
jgi:hypothetical protein